MNSHDEILDVVDDWDQVISKLERSKIYQKNLGFRVINAFLVNDLQKIWIPRRSPTKKLMALHLDASVGGHVGAGETYDEAFARELQEELNLNLAHQQYKLIAKLNPKEHAVTAHMQVYVIYTNTFPDYNRNDFIEAHWLSQTEVQELIRRGEPMKSDLPALIATLNNFLNSVLE